jgi:hypothetical protein
MVKPNHYHQLISRPVASVCLLGLTLLVLLISARTGPSAAAQSPTATPAARIFC